MRLQISGRATQRAGTTKWFIHVAEMFPTLFLELHYVESGNRLWGWLKSDNGIRTEAREWPILDGDNCEADTLMEERAWNWFQTA